MNYIRAVVVDIQNVDAINIVSFEADSQTMKMISLELDNRVQIGSEVLLAVKSTNIALAKGIIAHISISNQLKAQIKSIDYGAILCSVKIFFAQSQIESIITKEAAVNMDLQVNDNIISLIQANEISIYEVL